MSAPEADAFGYSDDERGQLRRVLIANKVAADRAHQIVDIACHAAEQSVKAVSDVVCRAPDGPIAMMAFEIALQLSRARMEAIFERTKAYGVSLSLPQYEAPVDLRA